MEISERTFKIILVCSTIGGMIFIGLIISALVKFIASGAC